MTTRQTESEALAPAQLLTNVASEAANSAIASAVSPHRMRPSYR